MAIISFDKDENMNSESSVVEKYLENVTGIIGNLLKPLILYVQTWPSHSIQRCKKKKKKRHKSKIKT